MCLSELLRISLLLCEVLGGHIASIWCSIYIAFCFFPTFHDLAQCSLFTPPSIGGKWETQKGNSEQWENQWEAPAELSQLSGAFRMELKVLLVCAEEGKICLGGCPSPGALAEGCSGFPLPAGFLLLVPLLKGQCFSKIKKWAFPAGFLLPPEMAHFTGRKKRWLVLLSTLIALEVLTKSVFKFEIKLLGLLIFANDSNSKLFSCFLYLLFPPSLFSAFRYEII